MIIKTIRLLTTGPTTELDRCWERRGESETEGKEEGRKCGSKRETEEEREEEGRGGMGKEAEEAKKQGKQVDKQG